MVGQGDDPELDLDPDPLKGDQEQEQQDDLEVEEQNEAPEGDNVDASQQQDDNRQEQLQQPSRGERRHQVLANTVREKDQQITELTHRLDQLLATQPRQTQGESPEARAQRRALLTAEERITEDLQLAQQQHSREMQTLQFTLADSSDRSAFSAKATVDPLYKKWEPQVEAELTTLRNQGMTAPREKIMYYLIGKAAVEGRQGTRTQQRREAGQRIARQQARPSNSGSDIAPQRRQNSSLERRLENQAL